MKESRSCTNCAYHPTVLGVTSIDQAPSQCWTCGEARGFPSWQARPVTSMADRITIRRIKVNPETPSPHATQVGGSHYTDLGIQPWEVMQGLLTPEEYRGYLKGNIIKYSIRQGRKPGSDDAAKARHYKEALTDFEKANR